MIRIFTRALCVLSVIGGAAPAFAQTDDEARIAAEDAEMRAILAQLETDPATAFSRIEAKATEGDREYLNLLGVVLRRPGEGMAADIPRADAAQRKAVQLGSDAARLNLGSALLDNDDLTDDAEAVGFLKAIGREDLTALAAYPLGRAYLFGFGVPTDLARGSELVIAAAENTPDNNDARYLAARALQQGWGVPVDDRAARTHFLAAADGGDRRAQWYVGLMLLNGEGGPADARRAHAYVRQSAELGYQEGQISLAVMLALGQGVAPDPAEARAWYRRAAENRSAHALRGLGAMLLAGEGGAPDLVTGAAYLELADEAGDENARSLRRGHFAGRIAGLSRAAVGRAKADWVARWGTPE